MSPFKGIAFKCLHKIITALLKNLLSVIELKGMSDLIVDNSVHWHHPSLIPRFKSFLERITLRREETPIRGIYLWNSFSPRCLFGLNLKGSIPTFHFDFLRLRTKKTLIRLKRLLRCHFGWIRLMRVSLTLASIVFGIHHDLILIYIWTRWLGNLVF
jgi:hypothetical protein